MNGIKSNHIGGYCSFYDDVFRKTRDLFFRLLMNDNLGYGFQEHEVNNQDIMVSCFQLFIKLANFGMC